MACSAPRRASASAMSAARSGSATPSTWRRAPAGFASGPTRFITDGTTSRAAGVHEVWPGRIDPHHRLPQRAGRAGDLVRGFPLYAQAHEEGCHLGRRRLAAHDDAEHLRREALAQRPAIGEERKRFLKRRGRDRKSTRLNSSHGYISYAVFCLKKKKTNTTIITTWLPRKQISLTIRPTTTASVEESL